MFDFFSKLSRTFGSMDFEISFLRDQLAFQSEREINPSYSEKLLGTSCIVDDGPARNSL